jgi:hypothetical protein
MKLKDFITAQRLGIIIIGSFTFAISVIAAHYIGFASLWGALLIDLASAAVTVIFTTLIIDYLGVREQISKTKNASGLAEDELKATCFRLNWRMARLYGLKHNREARENISSRQEAKRYVQEAEQSVSAYLGDRKLDDKDAKIDLSTLPRYLERLQLARTELEQTLVLYEYAMGYSLRERVLALRSELQIADNILGFLDVTDETNEANISMVRVLSQSIYEAIQDVLSHDSRVISGTPLDAKESRLA